MGLEVKKDPNRDLSSLANVKLNGSYEGFKAKVKPIALKDEVVRQRAESAFEQQVPKIEIIDGSLPQDSDHVSIKFESVDENGVKVENASGNLTFQIGKGRVYQEVEECVKGLKKNEVGNTVVKFPDNHPNFPGKSLTFTINLEKFERVPQFNDESVKSMNLPEVSTVEQYLEKTRIQLLDNENQKREHEINHSLQKQLESLVNAEELPEFLIQANTNVSYDNFLNSLETYGIKKEDYFGKTGQTEEGVRELLKNQAIADLKLTAALSKVASEKDIEVSVEELQEEQEKIMQEYQIEKEDLEKQISSDQLEESLKIRKAFEYVRSSADVEEISEAEKEI